MKAELEPYRIFFPIGIFFACAAALYWPLFAFGYINFYPKTPHGFHMICGFLLSFVIGFLMTAIPRMSATKPATRVELLVPIILFFLELIFPFLNAVSEFSMALVFLQFATLLAFILRRFRKAKITPPPSFIFLPAGILLGALGSLLSFFPSGETIFLGDLVKIYLFKGFMVAIVAGVGMRLLPVFLYDEAPPLPSEAPQILQRKMNLYPLTALLYLILLSLEPLYPKASNGLQLLLLSLLFGYGLRIYRFPSRKGVQPYGIWISLWCILSGQLWLALAGGNIHGIHFIYMGGLGMMSFLVATRVILSHGGHSLSLELKSKPLWIAIFFWLTALAARLSLAWADPNTYFLRLNTAAICWIVGIIFWFSGIGHKLFLRTSKIEDEAC